MKRDISISDEEHNDILQWLKEEIGFNGAELDGLSNKEITKEKMAVMKDTLSFKRWQLRKAYREFAAAMRETHLGTILIWIIEKINKMFEKIFCLVKE